MTREDRILVVGEALVDIVTSAAGRHSEHVGGSPANVALTLARLGKHADLLTHTGPDPYGELVRNHLSDNGVHLLGDGATGAKTSTAAATLAADGQATYEFDLDWELPEVLLAEVRENISSYACVHTGSIAAVLQPGGTQVAQLLDDARTRATISYDPNARPAIMGEAAQAVTVIEALVAKADVVKLSDEDARWLAPEDTDEQLAARWLNLGPSIVVITRGGAGAYGGCRDGSVLVRGRAVTVADTVGAGDSFSGALIDALAEADLLGADRRKSLREISTQQLREVLDFCVSVAAVTVSRPGADPPTRDVIVAGTRQG